MFKNLSPGAIGIRASLPEALKLAKAADFQGLEISINEVAKLIEERSYEYVKQLFADKDLRPGGWGLPVDWRRDEAAYQEGLRQLPRLAQIGQRLGCPRVFTWILPYSDERPFKENFSWHVARFQPIAAILRDHGCHLGLEFVGPKTLRTGHKYEFVYTMKGMLKLCEAIGTGNVGLLLDCWHWYTSHGTLNDLRRLASEQVVYVHVNDAPAGIPIDEQVDNVRCLPGETGIIDLVGFLKCLKEIGYDGPVTPEPFSQRVRQMPAPEAVKVTGETLNRVWHAAGLG